MLLRFVKTLTSSNEASHVTRHCSFGLVDRDPQLGLAWNHHRRCVRASFRLHLSTEAHRVVVSDRSRHNIIDRLASVSSESTKPHLEQRYGPVHVPDSDQFPSRLDVPLYRDGAERGVTHLAGKQARGGRTDCSVWWGRFEHSLEVETSTLLGPGGCLRWMPQT